MTARHGTALAALHAALDNLHREAGQSVTWTDEALTELLYQIVALEEIAAARWPRSAVLRGRLRRDLRASVRGTIHGRGFAERRIETLASGWMTRPGSRWARGTRHAS